MLSILFIFVVSNCKLCNGASSGDDFDSNENFIFVNEVFCGRSGVSMGGAFVKGSKIPDRWALEHFTQLKVKNTNLQRVAHFL